MMMRSWKMLICETSRMEKIKSAVFRQNLMSTAVIHLNLSLEKFCMNPINANIAVHKVRLIGFSPPLYIVSCVQYSSCLIHIRYATPYTSRDCISLALFIFTFLHLFITLDHLSLNSAGWCLDSREFFFHPLSPFTIAGPLLLPTQILLIFLNSMQSIKHLSQICCEIHWNTQTFCIVLNYPK